ncbi:MAG: hypothetical protein ACK4LR_13150 [Acidovorax temperans]|jgi:hypothetical protein|uniref:hypothetical protein n=1 Tax=Acidovorax temperans TaxID=80878 RepID=UPI001B47ABA5|nr:hypothetical protein [Comamonas sp.]
MSKQSLFQKLGISAVAVGAMLVAGCASMEPAKPEEIVAKRAQAFWDARAKGQVDKAYALTTPAYRKVHTLEQFKKQYGSTFEIKGINIVKVTCEVEKCTARAKIDVTPALMGINVGTIATHMDEIWLLDDGQWWRFQEL